MSPRSPAAETAADLRTEIRRLTSLASVQKAFDWFREQEPLFTEWQLEVSAIPAPPFGEGDRAAWLEEKFRVLGLKNVCQDEIGNVVGVQRARRGAVVSISAHLDTVFPAGTHLQVHREGSRLHGPGISDNSAGITALLAIAAACQKFDLTTASPLLFIGNVGEEGEGDLRGMRYLFSESEWKDSIKASIVLDGAGSDTIVSEALGSRRFEISIQGPGGHSWSDFGAPNPIVALARAVSLFAQTHVTSSPKTTFNIGVIRGGTSVNSIPESASMRVDIRSASGPELERLEDELRQAVQTSVAAEAHSEQSRNGRKSGLTASITTIGNRPAGQLSATARIVQVARAVDAELGNIAQIQRASTDANIPICLGREAIAIGSGGSGGGAHTLQEWFDPSGRELGLQRILLIALTVAGGME